MRELFLVASLMLLAVAALGAPEMLPRDWGQPLSLRQVAVIAPLPAQAEALVAALRARGADVSVVVPSEALQEGGLSFQPALLKRTLLLVGGIHDNPALLPLYGAYLGFSDARYPGGEGYVLRTVTAPFGPGTAALCLEASSPAGAQAAILRFTELLAQQADLTFSPALEVHLAPETQSLVAQAPYRSARYALTGNAADARAAIAALLAAADPTTGWFSYGDYGIERWVRECAYLQDAPGITPEEVKQLDTALWQTCQASADQWWRRRDGAIIGGRHQTMGTSSFATAVLLLRRRGNPNAEARALLDRWWAESCAYWEHACRTFHDDLEGIPCYMSPEPTLDWALQMGQANYVREQLPLAVRRAYAVVDNLGYYAGTGTYEECRPGDVYKEVPWGWLLLAANYFHPGQGYDWLQANMPHAYTWNWAVGRNFVGVRGFATTTPAVRPDHLLGITTVPLGQFRYDQLSHDRDAARAQSQRYVTAPVERCFEKLCCRDSFERDGQYLALEGFSCASADNLPPMDANTILRYTDLGHVWLHTNTEKSGNLPRTAVFCADGRNDSPQPAACELQARHSGQRVGLVASHLPDYTACDWTRNLIWRRGRYFVVLDLLRQNREGQFNLLCTFRTPQHAELQPDGLLAREGLAEMRVRNADGVRLALEGGDEIEGAALPTLLRENQLLDGKPGDLRVFRNLVYASAPEHPGDLQVRPCGPQAVLIRGTMRGETELALAAAAPSGQVLRVGKLETDGQVLYLGAKDWAQAGGTGVTVAGQHLAGTEGASPAAAQALLEGLWAAAKPASHPTTGDGAKTTGQRLWQAQTVTPLPAPIPAPALICEPAPEGLPGTLCDGVVTQWPTVRWPAGQAVKLTLDLRHSQPVSQIDCHVGLLGPFNTIPDPAKYPAPRTVVAEFSDDGFARDVRAKTLTFTSDCTFPRLHKGSVFPILRWTCQGLSERGRYLRLTFTPENWPGALGFSELAIRGAGPACNRTRGLLRRDVDGDGQRETISWSDQAELAVVRDDGQVMLKQQMPGAITAVACYPGLAAQPRLLVTTREARLYCLQPDGSEVWRTDFLETAKQNTDLPAAYSIGLLKQPSGAPLIVVGNYNLACFVSPEGQMVGNCRLPAAFQTMTLPEGFDYDGDGVEETVSTEVWGCLSVLDAKCQRRTTIGMPRGEGLLLDYWQPPTAKHARIIVATETGVGLVDLKTLKFDWRLNLTPLSACAVGDLNADGQPEIVLAKGDGYLLLLDGTGQVLKTVLVGETVRAVALVTLPDGQRRIVAALPGRLVAYPPDLGTPALVATGEFTHLAALSAPGQMVAAREGGALEAFRLGR